MIAPCILALSLSIPAHAQDLRRLANRPSEQARPDEIAPAIGVDAEVMATRLMAGRSAFEVQLVSYRLVGGTGACDSGMAHLLRVWKQADVVPAAVPRRIQTYGISEAPDADARVVTQALTDPILLDVGESLMVGVEMVRDDEISMCMSAAAAAPRRPDAQFISGALIPFRWQGFDDVGLEVTLEVFALGHIAD